MQISEVLRLIKNRAFTLIEAIFVIVVLSFVLIGGFQIVSKIYKRNYIAKKTAEFEFVSEEVLNQLAQFLYYRVDKSLIGYDKNLSFKYMSYITQDENYTILEWIGYLNDAMVERNLSTFVDLGDCNSTTFLAKDFNKNFITAVLQNKYDTIDPNAVKNLSAIIFAGELDEGEMGADDDNNSFGWHGNGHNLVYDIESINSSGDDANITLKTAPSHIYSKFYLVDSAYALALKKDLNKILLPQCTDLDLSKLDDNTLLLFYNYRPWVQHIGIGETFCADNRGVPKGNVTVLAENVASFRVKKAGNHLVILLQMQKQKGDINITISKQKVIY